MPSRLIDWLTAAGVSRGRRAASALIALAAAAALWLPLVHLPFSVPPGEFTAPAGIPPMARALAARHLQLWTQPDLKEHEIAKMRVSNVEWDFMGRTFLVLSLVNMGLREPGAADRSLEIVDQILDETLRLERTEGMFFFLMEYAKHGPYIVQPARSLFVDSEIALMLGARRLLRERGDYQPLFAERIRLIENAMGRGPLLCAESYPDECWMFDNTAALAALKMADAVDGSDHAPFFAKWLDTAKVRLTDAKTGLLVSSFSCRGRVSDGPEGSTIFMVSHWLQVIDEGFARDQYERAKRELGCKILGFGYAREWPASWVGHMDVDSGPVIPVLGVSAGSSGLAFAGASAFRDEAFLSSLLTTLNFAGFPSRRGAALKYCASNQVGDAVLLYAAVLGPLWRKVKEGTRGDR
jgi:hypothetical protein